MIRDCKVVDIIRKPCSDLNRVQHKLRNKKRNYTTLNADTNAYSHTNVFSNTLKSSYMTSVVNVAAQVVTNMRRFDRIAVWHTFDTTFLILHRLDVIVVNKCLYRWHHSTNVIFALQSQRQWDPKIAIVDSYVYASFYADNLHVWIGRLQTRE